MPDTTTPNYALTKVQVGGSRDTWGDKVNGNFDLIDTALKAAKDQAAGALPKAGGTVTGEVIFGAAGAFLHMSDNDLAHGSVTLAPAAGASPLVNPGDIWLGYA